MERCLRKFIVDSLTGPKGLHGRCRARGWSILASGLICVFGGMACAVHAPNDHGDFEHDFISQERPWSHERFDARGEGFSFAVFSDLTGGERHGVFEVAMAQLNLLRPAFIIGVGDLIEGESDDRRAIDAQWDDFDQRAASARAPVFYVGGNHDLSGVALQRAWDERMGRRYYHFIYRNTLFMVLDTEDHSESRTREIAKLRAEALKRVSEEGWGIYAETEYHALPEYAAGNVSVEQARYFTDVISRHPEVHWTFLFLHKAAWLREDDSGFALIEAALSNRNYTVFHGHEHAFQYRQRHGRDYIQLATTGGVQLPDKGRSMDHVMLVTVVDEGVDIASLLMEGILDRTGELPAGGVELCLGSVDCN